MTATVLTFARRRKAIITVADAVPARGYHAIYRKGERNFCPGCGHSQWELRATTAECCFCSTALMYSGGAA